MTPIMIGLAVLAALVAVGMLLFRRTAAAPQQPAAKSLVGSSSSSFANAGSPAAEPPAQARSTPPELAQLVLLHANDVPAERRASYLAVFRDVPRPPRLMYQLLQPDFVNDACSAELADLIRPEPVLAAKVLATVNSPLYGLSQSVAGVDQAVVYLGLDTVRSVCMQYLMISSFQTERPECRRLLNTLWLASAMASELAQRLAQPLGLEQRGALVSAVVLSFLGRLATVAVTPPGILSSIPPRALLERKQAEQNKFGLSASEIGRLLMTDWGLPAEVIADAADQDRLLTWNSEPLDHKRSIRLALCYICARLGERLAHGDLQKLSDFDLATDPDPEFFHVQRLLDAATLARLSALLKGPHLATAMARMRPAPAS